MSDLSHVARIVVTDCLNIQPHESVLIVTDEHKQTIAYAIWEAAKQINQDAMIIEMAFRLASVWVKDFDVGQIITFTFCIKSAIGLGGSSPCVERGAISIIIAS